MYAGEGAEGVPQNMIAGCAICFLAAASEPNNSRSHANREAIAKRMSKEHLDIARVLALEMQQPGNLLTVLDEFLNQSR